MKLQDDSKKSALDFAERERLWKAEEKARDELVAMLERQNKKLSAEVEGANAKSKAATESAEALRKELEATKKQIEEQAMEAERDAAAVAAASAAAIAAATGVGAETQETELPTASTQTDEGPSNEVDDEERRKQMAEMEILIAKQYEEMERSVKSANSASSELQAKLLEAEERVKAYSEEVFSLRQVAKEITELEHNMGKLKKRYDMAQKQAKAAREIPARIQKQLKEEQNRSGEATRKLRETLASEFVCEGAV